MGGYIGSKAVSLSTTSADVTGNADIGGDLTVDTNTLHVDSTNNRVGVGTVDPQYGALEVRQSANADENGISVRSAAGTRAMRLWVDETTSYIGSGDTGQFDLVLNEGGGSVGIGNTAPTHNLHVTDTGTPNLIIETTAVSGEDAKLRIRGSRTTSVAGDLAQILFETNDETAAGDTLAFITAGKDAANTNKGVIRFGTTGTDGGTPSERMRIGSDGKITVGPDNNFEVNPDPSASLSAVYIRSGEGINGGSSTDLTSGTQLLSIHGDTDALQVRNINVGDYSIVNNQQANGIAFYDGTGGLGFFYNNSEKAEVTSSGFATVSDERLKDQQGDIDVDAISVFNSLNLFKYHPKAHADDASGDTDTMMYGFSAQQLNQLAPHAVNEGVDDLSDDPKKPWYSVSDTSLKALMIQAIKTLSAENEAMKARLDALEAN